MGAHTSMRLADDPLWRARVAFSAALLLLAWLLVRCVRLSRWRWTLGEIGTATPAPDAHSARSVRALAQSVERAAVHLPFAGKCLPQGVALQWRLRLARIPSRLVIAFHLIDRSGDHGFHAWVEHGGEMVLGACDRSVYQPAMTLSQGGATPFADRP